MTTDSGPLARRRAGVLLHVSSLPGGRVGPYAYAFVDFLAAAGCSVWQVLPLVPPDEEGSPYRALSAMAGHPGLLDPAPAAPWPDDPAYLAWCEQQAHWLDPYVEYLTVRTTLGGRPWPEWEPALRDRDQQRVAEVLAGAPDLAGRIRSDQWRFAEQWGAPAHLRRGPRRPALRRPADLRRPRQRGRLVTPSPLPARRVGAADDA